MSVHWILVLYDCTWIVLYTFTRHELTMVDDDDIGMIGYSEGREQWFWFYVHVSADCHVS